MFKTILVATDGSEHADKAVDLACDLAAKYDARLLALHVLLSGDRVEKLRHWAEIEHIGGRGAAGTEAATGDVPLVKAPTIAGGQRNEFLSLEVAGFIGDQILKEAADKAKAKGVRQVKTRIEDGNPTKCVLECAKQEGADLIVIGSRGLGDLASLLMGSVSHKVSHLAECTCITVK